MINNAKNPHNKDATHKRKTRNNNGNNKDNNEEHREDFFRNFRNVYSEYYKRHLHLSPRRKFIELRENAIIIKITINETFLTSSLAIFEPSTSIE